MLFTKSQFAMWFMKSQCDLRNLTNYLLNCVKIYKIAFISRAGPLTGMKNVEMRVRRRNYVIDFSNFQVKISINVQFHKSTVWNLKLALLRYDSFKSRQEVAFDVRRNRSISIGKWYSLLQLELAWGRITIRLLCWQKLSFSFVISDRNGVGVDLVQAKLCASD